MRHPPTRRPAGSTAAPLRALGQPVQRRGVPFPNAVCLRPPSPPSPPPSTLRSAGSFSSENPGFTRNPSLAPLSFSLFSKQFILRGRAPPARHLDSAFYTCLLGTRSRESAKPGRCLGVPWSKSTGHPLAAVTMAQNQHAQHGGRFTTPPWQRWTFIFIGMSHSHVGI